MSFNSFSKEDEIKTLPVFFNEKEVLDYLRISESLLDLLINNRRIPYYEINQPYFGPYESNEEYAYIFNKNEIDVWLKTRLKKTEKVENEMYGPRYHEFLIEQEKKVTSNLKQKGDTK